MGLKPNSNPSPTEYQVKSEFDEFHQIKGKETSCFKSPVLKKVYPVNLYNPHQPVSPKVKMPGPGHYDIEDKDTIKEKTNVDAGYLNSVKLTSAFIQENTDRFGNQLYPTQKVIISPGPADYNSETLVNKRNPQTFAATIAERDVFTDRNRKEAQNIGPGVYTSNLEPKKISFFLNQGDKWVA
mmetsp:Transcript_10580/g.12042  ORF Transcript_10580/g.12042 Transcript_10580/m.12042 type:complete len:183 (-) Transcript_10580:8-556(-)